MTVRFYDAACRRTKPAADVVLLPDQFLGVEPQGEHGRAWLYVATAEDGESQHILLDRPSLQALATLLKHLAEEPD